MIRSSFVVFALANVLAAQAPPTAVATPAVRPVDLAICLDVSGSMDGLIDSARQNLWSVVNELATLQPTPRLRVALLTFGCTAYDPASGWVRVDTPFTSDLDTVSQKLFALQTNGGDEYVARVMQAALELDWSSDPEALKLLFVAGNEAATQDPTVDGPTQSRAAIARGIVVDTIFCGSPSHQDAPGWREVSKLADGQFATIEKDQAVVITTPFDAELTEISGLLNTTYVPFGRDGGVWAANQVSQDQNAVGLNPAAAAQRCQTKGGSLYENPHWDLVDACRDAKFDWDKVKKEELPEALRGMTTEQLRGHVAEQQKKRDALKVRVDAIGKERDAFVKKEMEKLGAAGKAMFETAVLEAVRQQAEAKGFRRAPKEAPKAAVAGDCDSPFVSVVRDAARDYRRLVCVTGSPKVAPQDCRMSPPFVKLSEAGKEHGKKLYLLFARFAEKGVYTKAGEPAKVGQTLVKEAWVAVPGEPSGPTEASRRYVGHLVFGEGDQRFHGGDAAGLFVMHKLAADTPDTDQGWVYGTIDPAGHVTAAGRIASCMACHEDGTEDRCFGLR